MIIIVIIRYTNQEYYYIIYDEYHFIVVIDIADICLFHAGLTPLLVACSHVHKLIIKSYLNMGADALAVDSQGHSALWHLYHPATAPSVQSPGPPGGHPSGVPVPSSSFGAQLSSRPVGGATGMGAGTASGMGSGPGVGTGTGTGSGPEVRPIASEYVARVTEGNILLFRCVTRLL